MFTSTMIFLNGVFQNTYDVVKTEASLMHVNGGNIEYIAREQINNREKFMRFAVNLLTFGSIVSVGVWAIKNKQNKEKA